MRALRFALDQPDALPLTRLHQLAVDRAGAVLADAMESVAGAPAEARAARRSVAPGRPVLRCSTTLASVLIASAEGAVVLSRADQSLEPFETVARQLTEQVRSMTR